MPDQPILPAKATAEEIKVDAGLARAEFRHRRLGLPLADYEATYPTTKAAADTVIAALNQVLKPPADKDLLASFVANKAQFSALRSLAASPISEDDLDTLLDESLNRTALRKSQELADKLSALLVSCLDPKRFPWVIADREATPEELAAAQLATAVLVTVSTVQAGRRGEESKALEGKVEEILLAAGYTKAPKRNGGIKQIAHFPARGTFVRATIFGSHNGDYVIGLKDGRILALECKASNSEVNGFKRLNKEVCVDAGDWYREFGHSSVVAAAALRGVFKPANVLAAQNQNVYIFWWHKLDALADFLSAAVPQP